MDRLRRLVRRAAPAHGLSRAQEAALVRLDLTGPLTTAELARCEQVRPQSMGQVVTDLTRTGLVGRRDDATDRRRVLLKVTVSGRAAAAQINRLRDRDLAALLSEECTTDQLDALARALAVLDSLGANRP